jgi:3-methyladenine DNA glycosylase AlkD
MIRKSASAGEAARKAVDWLRKRGSKAGRDGMARFAIPSDKAFGVSMREVQRLAGEIGRDHDVALALWDTGWLEARMLTAYVDEPEHVTAAQMDRWCREFDNWAVVDTLCFALFDRTPFAWRKVEQWSKRKDEFQKRAGFALLWSLSVHDKVAPDDRFLRGLEIIEREAKDERNFVKKAVNMALRAIGKRNRTLHSAALKVASRLAASADATARWNGKDALRELQGASVMRRLKAA